MSLDPHKVFFGQLRLDLWKPDFVEWLVSMGLPTPDHCYMVPPKKENQLQIAFCTWTDSTIADNACQLNGRVDAAISPSFVVVFQGLTHMEAFYYLGWLIVFKLNSM